MYNFYFTFWISKHGQETFKELTDKVYKNITVPMEIEKKMDRDEYLFHYFLIVYYVVTLDYFGLNTQQISYFLDFSITLGTSELFPPSKILEDQKDVIPDILKFVKEDLQIYEKD